MVLRERNTRVKVIINFGTTSQYVEAMIILIGALSRQVSESH